MSTAIRYTIATTSLNGIRPVLGTGVGEGIRRFTILRALLHKHQLYAVWAQPVPDSASIRWFTELPGAVRPYSSLPPDVQQKARQVLKYYVDAVYALIDHNLDADDLRPILDDSFEIPALDCLYLVEKRPVLVLWGYLYSEVNPARGLIRKLTRGIDPPRLLVNVKVVRADSAEPMLGADVRLMYEGETRCLTTNDQGNVSFQGIRPFDYPCFQLEAESDGYLMATGSLRLDRPVVELIWSGFTPLITTLTLHPKPVPAEPEVSALQGERGTFSVNLRWHTTDDLDLLVTDPGGNLIYYQNRRADLNGCVGILDVDSNASDDSATDQPQENIYWEKTHPGPYRIEVLLYKRRTNPASDIKFDITILHQEDRLTLPGRIRTEKEQQLITIIDL